MKQALKHADHRPARGQAAPSIHRGARRKLETRGKLIRAAQQVMAQKGIDAASIQDITETADVGFGSFYNHFDSKEAIVEAILTETLDSFGDSLDRLAAGIADPAEVLSASVRHVVRRAMADHTWGGFVVRCGPSVSLFRIGLVRRLTRDIGHGVQAGRFDVEDLDCTVLAVSGTVLAVISSLLNNQLANDAPERAAAVALRLMGLSWKEAKKVAARPLPDISGR
jgi:AcrR family transcriptional regulator